MIIQITGDTGGLEPYDIFICDPTNTGCFYVSGLTYIPATVEINTQNFFPNENFINFLFIFISAYQDQIRSDPPYDPIASCS